MPVEAANTHADSKRPLNILLGCDTFAPDVNGAARFTERLAAGLSARGHNVHIVAPSVGKNVGTFIETIEGQRLTVHRWRSVRWHPHEWLRFVLPWHAKTAARQLLRHYHPDAIHIQSHIIIGRALTRAADNTRIIATNHIMPENILDRSFIPEIIWQAFVRAAWRDATRILRKASSVTTPTQRAADFLERNTGRHGVLAVSCGLNAADYTPNLQPRSERRLIFVGRVTQEKQVDVILRALARLNQNKPTRLTVIGKGDQIKSLERLAEQLKIADTVTFRGHVSDKELRQELSQASIFTIASIAELQSIATMEAMASGLPIVAANAMALPHLVRDKKNGYLFQPGNDRELAAAAEKIFSLTPEKYLKMQQASLQVVEKHDINRTLDIFEALYRGEQPPQ